MNKEIKERLGRYCTFTKVTIDEENNSFVEISCVINKLEEQKLKEIINDVDPDAFIAIYDTEVNGNMKNQIYIKITINKSYQLLGSFLLVLFSCFNIKISE